LRIDEIKAGLIARPATWLVTGVAGFIGSHLLETLLSLGQKVVGLDNFATGHRHNLADVQASVGERAWRHFTFIEGDITRLDDCRQACRGVDFVLHQAALGSVPRSLEDPIRSNATNVSGFLNMLVAARDEGVKRFVYAASSSTYGDHPGLPKIEDTIGRPLSPYAVTKYVNELYADVFQRSYGLSCVGLRYFNVFGPRQDPHGAYAAVIPRWIDSILKGEPIQINGDGLTSRDFCFVANAVQANILAARADLGGQAEVFNVAVGEQTSLLALHAQLSHELVSLGAPAALAPVHRDTRKGDVKHSLADIDKARRLLGYAPTHRIGEGLAALAQWSVARSLKQG
jgi:UDP-N-acetylglucosamine 4-epimerase